MAIFYSMLGSFLRSSKFYPSLHDRIHKFHSSTDWIMAVKHPRWKKNIMCFHIKLRNECFLMSPMRLFFLELITYVASLLSIQQWYLIFNESFAFIPFGVPKGSLEIIAFMHILYTSRHRHLFSVTLWCWFLMTNQFLKKTIRTISITSSSAKFTHYLQRSDSSIRPRK